MTQKQISLSVNCDLDLGDMTLSESNDTNVFNIIQIKHESKELWVWHIFWLCENCDLDLQHMTLGQGHGTPLDQGKQWCKILSRSNMAVGS